MNRRISRGLESWGLVVLAVTTLLWATLGALLQAGNADQLADSYLFDDAQTFAGSSFPNQHTFFLKWPLFWLQSVIGLNQASFAVLTVLVVFITVGSIAYLLHRIEKRPEVRGVLYLAMASVLLLTPAVPYAGALLPTNFAMITTRNMEYVVYIAALLALAKRNWSTKWQLIGSASLMTVLFVSDGLFPPLSIGGALLLLLVAIVRKRQAIRAYAQRWLGVAVAAYVGSTTVLKAIEQLFPGKLVGQESPYALISSLHDGVLAGVYGLSGLLTNFGANPAYAAKTIGEIPHTIIDEMSNLKLPAYLLNGFLICLAVIAMYSLVKRSLWTRPADKKERSDSIPAATLLALALITTTIVAFISFIATDHYYLVDSRYLAIFFFSGITSIAVFGRSLPIKSNYLKAAVVVCSLAILSGGVSVVQTYHSSMRANEVLSDRNELIVEKLQTRKDTVLVGDYWRVLPVRLASENHQIVLPLADCTTPRNVLTSSVWQPDLKTTSFAYLLTSDGSPTDYPDCSLAQVIAAYGNPTGRQIIAGDSAQPREVLLLYDRTK